MDSLTELASAFAVNDADLAYAAFEASGEIVQNQVFHLARLEVM